MITMKVADEDVIDFAALDLVTAQLHLCSFTAIDQKQLIIVI
jgi:hypothetical protein